MSFFKRAMASIGIGSAKVDAVLDSRSFRVGDVVTGKVYVKGGNVEQVINKISIKTMSYYYKQSSTTNEDGEYTVYKEDLEIGRVQVSEGFTLGAKENREFTFSMTIPYDTPITFNREAVWIETDLDIASAIDSTDRDYIEVLPHPYVQYILDILMGKMDLKLVECEHKYTSHPFGYFPIIQEFEFKPKSILRDKLEELEVIFTVNEHGVEMIMEIDQRARGLKGFMLEQLDMDESVIRIKIPADVFENDSESIEDYLFNTIMKYL